MLDHLLSCETGDSSDFLAVRPHCGGSEITSCTNVLHCCLSLANRKHSTTVPFVQSLTSSARLCLGLPHFLLPSTIPAFVFVHKFLAWMTWPKYWSLYLCTVVSRRSCGCTSCSTDALVWCVIRLTLNSWWYAVISKYFPSQFHLMTMAMHAVEMISKSLILYTPLSTAFTVHVSLSHPQNATAHTDVDKSLHFALAWKRPVFPQWVKRSHTSQVATPSLAWILWLQSPFSAIIAPKYLNVSSCSSSLPYCDLLLYCYCHSFVFCHRNL